MWLATNLLHHCSRQPRTQGLISAHRHASTLGELMPGWKPWVRGWVHARAQQTKENTFYFILFWIPIVFQHTKVCFSAHQGVLTLQGVFSNTNKKTNNSFYITKNCLPIYRHSVSQNVWLFTRQCVFNWFTTRFVYSKPCCRRVVTHVLL